MLRAGLNFLSSTSECNDCECVRGGARYYSVGPPANSAIVFVNSLGSNSLTGDAPGNAKATVSAAAGALPSGGGCVMVGKGSVALGTSAFDAPAGLNFQGVSRYQSIINCATGPTAGTPAFQCYGGGENQATVISDVTIIGPLGNNIPSTGVSLDVSGWGVLTGNQTVLQRANVADFYSNICVGATGESLNDVRAAGSWYDLYFVNTVVQGGQYLNKMQLYTAALGCIGIAPGANMSAMRAVGVGTGQAPYGLYVEPRTGGAIANTNLEIRFESIGNELVHDATTGSGGADSLPAISRTTWHVGEFSCASGEKASAYPSDYSFYATMWDNTFVNCGGQYGLGTGPPGGTAAFGSPMGANWCSFDTMRHGQQVNGARLNDLYVNPQRPTANFVAGTGITITPTDDQPNQRTTITVATGAQLNIGEGAP